MVGDPYRHEQAAEDRLLDLAAEFRAMLQDKACEVAGPSKVSAFHVEEAFRKLLRSDESVQKDSQAILDAAFRENRPYEWVAYGGAIILFVLGIVLILYGVLGADSVATRVTSITAGSIVELLLWGPLRFAVNCRRSNIATRMLGTLLDRVDDPETLAPLLKETFMEVVSKKT